MPLSSVRRQSRGPSGYACAPRALEASGSIARRDRTAYETTEGLIALVPPRGLRVTAIPASAELHSVQVDARDGQRITVTVDVPPGTPVEPDHDPAAHRPVIADHRPRRRSQTPTPSRRRGARPRPSPAPPPSPPPPTRRPAPDGNAPPGAPNRHHQRRRPAATVHGAPASDANADVSAGNLNAKKVDGQLERDGARRKTARPAGRTPDGAPTPTTRPSRSRRPGPAPIGVPNFFIDKFRIPPFLLPIYQAAGIEYGVRWEVLAAINEIETDYGRNLNVSSAGAVGWMQFMPVDLEAVRRRRQPGRPARTRTTRSTRSSPPRAT